MSDYTVAEHETLVVPNPGFEGTVMRWAYTIEHRGRLIAVVESDIIAAHIVKRLNEGKQ